MEQGTRECHGTTAKTSSSFVDKNYDEDDDDFMTRIVHNSCNAVDMDGACYNGSGANQLNLLTHCHQPFSFLSFCHHHNPENAVIDVASLPAGAYTLPAACEYCGAADTRTCNQLACHRPSLYFQARRPPFCTEEQWQERKAADAAREERSKTPPTKLRESSSGLQSPRWVVELFGTTPKQNPSQPTTAT